MYSFNFYFTIDKNVTGKYGPTIRLFKNAVSALPSDVKEYFNFLNKMRMNCHE